MKRQRQPLILVVMVALFALASPVSAQEAEPQEFEDITQIVADVRGLEPLRPIELTPMTREQLAVELQEDLLEDYPEDEQYADERELLAFGLMDEHIDFGDLYIDLYSEQIAGYYDPETSEMVVIRDATDEAGFTPSQEVTYAHEIVHALQDQHFDLDAGVLDREPLSDDQALAVTALIEGDASYAELQYLMENPELLEAFLQEIEVTEFDSSVLDAAPVIISNTLIFPYEHGLTFVEALYSEGGWDLVNQALADPPASTEQILHPEKYLDGGAPVEIEVADFTQELGDDWTVFDTNTFGEYQLRVILGETSMGEEQAERAAAGWGGDTYLVAGTDTEDAILWESAWDTPQDAEEFARAWALYETERWGVGPTYVADNVLQFETDEVVTRVILDGDEVTYAMAPNVEMLETILAAEAAPATPAATPIS
ncbi:MAG TPA: hypothetical protein VGR22_07080 [Thermomicrobiales bacterium]|nr:hypothetical protein [Thermomicrobiales bacterium]